MDFARKQLEKYGWSTGKGLGKHEDGISEALKPKLKRSVTGIGHNAAEDFTEHWWTALYNKAAENVEFKQKNGDSKKFKTKDSNAFEITNSTWKLHKKQKDTPNEQYKDFFVKTEILGNDGTTNIKDSESESEDDMKKDVFKLTDEELFAACGGRTAHKGARFGLKATGKLARIKQQEEKLLDLEKYSGYSHAKNRNSGSIAPGTDGKVSDDTKTDVEMVSDTCSKKKKKKRKPQNKEDLYSEPTIGESTDNRTIDVPEKQIQPDNKSNIESIKKKKKSKRKISEPVENNDENSIKNVILEDDSEINTKKKKCKRKNTEKESTAENIEQNEVNVKKIKKKKKSKNK